MSSAGDAPHDNAMPLGGGHEQPTPNQPSHFTLRKPGLQVLDNEWLNRLDKFLCQFQNEFQQIDNGVESGTCDPHELIDLLSPYLQQLGEYGSLGIFGALDSSYAGRFYSLLNRALTRIENRFGSLERLEPQRIQVIITLGNFVIFFQSRAVTGFRPQGERV